jgi:hypothetical protein
MALNFHTTQFFTAMVLSEIGIMVRDQDSEEQTCKRKFYVEVESSNNLVKGMQRQISHCNI